MSYRPYPNVDCALAQVGRGRHPAPLSEMQQHLAEGARSALAGVGRGARPFVEALRQVRVNAPSVNLRSDAERAACGIHISVIRAAEWRARNALPVDEYRLSTR